MPDVNENNKLLTRVYIMGRYGMLQCGANFSMGYGDKNCGTCGVTDDECHRINYCSNWRDINLYESADKLNFELIYSENVQESLVVVDRILKMWDLGNGRNCMRIPT